MNFNKNTNIQHSTLVAEGATEDSIKLVHFMTELLLPPLYGSKTPYILMLSFYVHQFPTNFFISSSLIHHLP